MPLDSDLHETRTNAEHSETAAEFRVTFESRANDLYFVRAANFVKIGRTRNLERRLVSIQTGCPFGIDAAFSFPGMGKLEKDIHWSLAGQRAHGEWFIWGEAAERQLNEMRRRAFVGAQALQFLRDRAANRGDY